MITLSALAVTLFFGGWDGPWTPSGRSGSSSSSALAIFVFIWLRATLPRLRYDQLMRFGWKVLLPVATLNALITALLVVGVMSPQPVETLKGFARHLPQDLQEADHRSSTPSTSVRSTRASAAAIACTATRTGSRSASAARSARPRARPTASASSPAENTPSNRVSAGERYARIYEINLSRCIFCGYCELACPFDAITLGNEFELSEYSRDDLIYTKDMLLAEPIKTRPGRRPRSLRHADPLLQGRVTLVASSAELPRLGRLGARRLRLSRLGGSRSSRFSNPFYSALALIGNLGSLAVLYLLLSAEFVAAAQVLIYAGAVMVMFLFVIAYLGGRADAPWAGGPSWQTVGAVAAAGAILVEIIVALGLQAGGSLSHAKDLGVVRKPGGDRQAVPDRPPARLRDHLDRAAGGGGRRGRPRVVRQETSTGGPTRDERARTSPPTSWSPPSCS